MVKRLFLALLLISPVSFADWGDVYYCQMTSLVEIYPEGAVRQYELQKFQFKLDRAKKSMVFGKGGFFADDETSLDPSRTWLNMERWVFTSYSSKGTFRNGKFMYSLVTEEVVTSISADCDKF